MSEGYDVSDFSFDRCIERLETQLRNSEARNATSLEVIRAREEHVEQQRVEIDRLKREGSPGVMHAVDQAFYELTVKERNAAYEKVRRLEEELAFRDRRSGVERYLSAECQQDGCLVHKLNAEIGQLTRDLGEARTAARRILCDDLVGFDMSKKYAMYAWKWPWLKEVHDGI